MAELIDIVRDEKRNCRILDQRDGRGWIFRLGVGYKALEGFSLRFISSYRSHLHIPFLLFYLTKQSCLFVLDLQTQRLGIFFDFSNNLFVLKR